MTPVDIRRLAGQRLGQYVLEELIGLGGMSAVYRAYQPSLEREVAIKVLAIQLAADTDYQQRFVLEARTAAALEHPHIVPIHDYGAQDALVYVVMRLFTGGSLAQRLRYSQEGGHPLPSPAEAADLLDTLADALAYAHERGIIHRDIKPSNVVFDRQGTPHLVDFGIARIMNADLGLTAAGTTIGTPNYMAPEQWRDEPLTPAVDQYALGILIFNTLTGRLPFEATTAHILMQKHLNEPPPPVHTLRPGLAEALSPVLARALAKLPEERYPEVTDLAAAFRAAAGDGAGETTGFFTFPLPASALALQPTPPADAVAAPAASMAQAVPLAAPSGVTMASDMPPLPEASQIDLPGSIGPASLPEWSRAMSPAPRAEPVAKPAARPAASGRAQPAAAAPAVAPAVRQAQPPVRHVLGNTPRHPRQRPSARLNRTALIIGLLALAAVIALIVFVLAIRAINAGRQVSAPLTSWLVVEDIPAAMSDSGRSLTPVLPAVSPARPGPRVRAGKQQQPGGYPAVLLLMPAQASG